MRYLQAQVPFLYHSLESLEVDPLERILNSRLFQSHHNPKHRIQFSFDILSCGFCFIVENKDFSRYDRTTKRQRQQYIIQKMK